MGSGQHHGKNSGVMLVRQGMDNSSGHGGQNMHGYGGQQMPGGPAGYYNQGNLRGDYAMPPNNVHGGHGPNKGSAHGGKQGGDY